MIPKKVEIVITEVPRGVKYKRIPRWKEGECPKSRRGHRFQRVLIFTSKLERG